MSFWIAMRVVIPPLSRMLSIPAREDAVRLWALTFARGDDPGVRTRKRARHLPAGDPQVRDLPVKIQRVLDAELIAKQRREVPQIGPARQREVDGRAVRAHSDAAT